MKTWQPGDRVQVGNDPTPYVVVETLSGVVRVRPEQRVGLVVKPDRLRPAAPPA